MCFEINKRVRLYVQLQSLVILSLDTSYDHVENLEGDISMLICVRLFLYVDTLSYLMLQYLIGLWPLAHT